MEKVSVERFVTILVILTLVASLVPIGMIGGQRKAEAASTGSLIARVYTDKARYNPSDPVTIYVEMENKTGANWSGPLTLVINHLETQVYTASQAISLNAGAKATQTFSWAAPATDFRGYFVGVSAGSNDSNSTSIDVSSKWTRYPRYGYIAEYSAAESAAQSAAKINLLAQDYRINALQFYDWMWRHDKLIKRTNGTIDSTWQDLFNRTISWATIQNQISAAQAQNVASLAYVMSYAAREGYDQFGISPQWGIFSDTSHTNQLNVDFGNGTYLWLFNPANLDWLNYMVAEYKDAIATAGFDGLQIDQMGQRDNVHSYNGQSVGLPTTFPQFLRMVKEDLTAANSSRNNITFNIVDGTVNGWAANEVSSFAPTDFNFSEIWWKANRYNDIRAYVEQVRRNSGGKPVVLATYMNYGENIGPRYEAESATLVGVGVNTNHPGYTGTGFVDLFDAAGKYVEFSITAPEDGEYSFVFRYGNATGFTASRNVYVDGTKKSTIFFKNQANWDTWAHDAYYSTFLTAGTHLVRLAFDADNAYAINLDSLTLGTFEESSIRLADAVFAASGAYHIELGEGSHMLANEYYPDTSKSMRNSLKAAMRDHYNFITAYENLLFDPDIQTPDAGNQWISITNEAISGDGTGGTIWHIIKRNPSYDIINLINLTNNDDQWRNSGNIPTLKYNLPAKYYPGPDVSVSGVYMASADIDHGLTRSLSFTTGSDASGNYISFTVPSLQYWDLIYIRRTMTAPAGDLYEAETAIKTGVTTNTNHTGYTGTGFVDGFTVQNSGVSFVINAPADDSYTLRFRYANATGATATRTVFVDGQSVGTVSMRSLNNWDFLDTADKVVRLSPGQHSVVIWYTASDSTAINLDSLKVIRETNPSSSSAASLYLSNWQDMIALWMDSHLAQADTGTYGPRIGELRYSGQWSTNQIVDYTGFFRDETNATKYTNAHSFNSEGWFESDGTVTTNYLNYGTSSPPVRISRNYGMVPNQPFLLVKYVLSNPTGSALTYSLLDQVHVNNVQKGSGVQEHGWYDSTRNAIFVDMTPSGQGVLAIGALQPVDGYQVGDDTNSNTVTATVAPWYKFDESGTLPNNSDLYAADMSVAFQKRLNISANGTATASFYITVRGTLAAAQAAVDAARAQTADYWFSQTAAAYGTWLNSGKRVNFADPGLNKTFDRGLIVTKNIQNPTIGGIPATTNPFAYGYKVWVRDASVTSMALDASGHYPEAEKFWRWMASVQNTDGSWHTTFDTWTGNWVSFVEPEHDSIGMFLLGVYRHYQLTGDAAFLNDLWPAVQKAADFVMNNIGTNGFGPADSSIWEENIEYNTFTQSLYVIGLNAAQYLARAKGDTAKADSWNGATGTILSAIQRSFEWNPRGLYNDANRYFNRAVNTDGTAFTKVDSSSDIGIALGMLDWASGRAQDHRIKILSTLVHDTFGVARYTGDTFYYTSPYSPGGDEAKAVEPVWPQMTMYVGLQELYGGRPDLTLARMQWYASRTGKGYMPVGEAVSWVTQQPAVSTMAEPITNAAFIITALAYQNMFDPRLVPPQYNAGAYKAITVNLGTDGDWPQWRNVPYFLDKTGDTAAGSTMGNIKKAYVSNDGGNIYIRIDNASGSLSAFNTSPKFAVMVYAEDYNHAAGVPATGTGFYGGVLDRPMQYMVARWSDGSGFSRFKVVNGAWSWDRDITEVIGPQWDTATGRIEVVVPISVLTSTGTANMGDWTNLNIGLAYQDPTTGAWRDEDLLAIHYRLTASGTAWLYGNVER